MTARQIAFLICILAAAFLVRATVVIGLRDVDALHGDAHAYFANSLPILDSGMYLGRRAPAYPALLGGAQFLFAGTQNVRICQWVNIVLGVLGVLGVYFVGVLLHGRRLGGLAASVVALDPRYVSHVLFPMVENGYVPALIWSLVVVIWGVKKPSAQRGLLAGVMIGVAALTRSIIFPFLPLAACAALIVGAKRWRGNVAFALCMIVGAALTIGPWTLRNYYVYNRFVPIALDDGPPLVAGNVWRPAERRALKAEAQRVALENLGEDDPRKAERVEANAFLRQKGLELIIERQPRWILEKIYEVGPRLLLPGGWFLQRGLNDPALFGEQGVKVVSWLFVSTQVVILLLAPFGLGRRSRSAGDIILILYVLCSFGIHIVTHMISLRFQLPYLWIIILFTCRAFVDRPPWNRWRIAVTAAFLSIVIAALVTNGLHGIANRAHIDHAEIARGVRSQERTLNQRKIEGTRGQPEERTREGAGNVGPIERRERETKPKSAQGVARERRDTSKSHQRDSLGTAKKATGRLHGQRRPGSNRRASP